MTTTRSPGSGTTSDLPSKAELARLKLSPEVAWYLLTHRPDERGVCPVCRYTAQGHVLPDRPPAVKTPEPRQVAGARFDPTRVDRVLKSFGRLRHTKGDWAGRELLPAAWQVAYILAPVFGWVKPRLNHLNRKPVMHPVTGKPQWVRIIRNLFADLPRKNGKSTTIGGIGIYLTAADGEPGAEVVTAATTIHQARYVFDPVKQLASSSPGLKGHLVPHPSRITHPRSGSYLEVVANVADALHGGNLHGGIVDELHVHKTPDLVEAIETGTGSRAQPLVAIITTADDGRVDTVYARKREYVEKLARRVFKDPTTYGVIWCAGPDDDPFAEETWAKANPGYPISPTYEYMVAAANKAQNSPAELTSFLRFHLGRRERQNRTWLPLDDWRHSAGMVVEEKLADRLAIGGLDLSAVEDITALCWTFPDDDGGFDVLWRFWLPEAKADVLRKRTAHSSDQWAREGWLTLTPGNVIDHDVIVAQILADAEKFQVAALAYDRWSANEIVRRLGDEGLLCLPVGQGFMSMSQPMKEILRAVKAKKYRHGGNPVMTWMVDNLAVRLDPAGNVKPDKERSGDKIDGVSAAATAMREVLDRRVEEESLPPADIF